MRLFVGRIFHGDGDSTDSELGLTLGLVLSLLALPGGLYSILLAEKYSTLLLWMRHQRGFDPLAGALPDEYFFIVLSMTVTGVVAVWRWDSIFPDRRDFSNLVHLPISMRRIFLANVVAIVFLAMVLAFDVNAISALLFPLVVSASVETFSFFVQFVWVHALVVILASLFSFFAVFVTVGALMIVLPYRAFRRISLYARSVLMACLVATLSTSFAVPSMLEKLPETWVRFLPPVWFLGLCQVIRGRANASLALLGHVALISSAGIIAGAVVIYAISYRRCFAQIPQTANTAVEPEVGRLPSLLSILDRTVLKTPFERAGYRFAMKTLLRSENHGLVFAGFLGLGIVVASQFLFVSFNGANAVGDTLPASEILAIPLVMSYCIILGMRFVFDVPTDMRANWIFKVNVDAIRHQSVPLARKLVLTFVLPWVFVIVLPLYWRLWGWQAGVVECVVVTLWSFLLTDILLLQFRKIPFTCSYPPFRNSAGVLLVFYILGFFAYVVLTANLVRAGLSEPVLLAVLIGVGLISELALRRTQRGTDHIEAGLIFEEKVPADFELLDISRTRG